MTEHHFEVETRHGVIRGMLHEPHGEAAPGAAAVLIVHGYFSASRVGPARLYVELARHLCAAGFRVFRADCLGVGDSDGRFEDVTLQSELRDLRAVASRIQDTKGAAGLILLGHSMGGNLCLRIAAELPAIAKIILIAPDLIMRNRVDQFFDEAQLAELATNGSTLRKGLHINNSFVQELRNIPALEIAASLALPMSVLQGSEDELYERAGAMQLAAAARRGTYIEIPGADHNFFTLSGRSQLFQAVASECRLP